MATPIEMPKLGNTVEECIIGKWSKRKGDAVAAGDLVVEIETDKATFEVTAPVAGTILATFFDEGALVPVFTNIFVLGDPGEDAEAFRPGASAPAAAEPTPAPAQPAPETAAPLAVASASGPMSPRARRFAQDHNFQPGAIAGSGPGGRILEDDVKRAYFTTPRVSAAATQHMAAGLVAPAIGSGAGGMVLSSDLAARVASEAAQVTKLTHIRSKIAARMRDSLQSTAQYTLNSSADAGGLLILRARVKASKGAVPDININDLVVFSVVRALLDVPEMNAEFIDGHLHKHSAVHIGFAVDTPRGLMVPVVRDAHALSAGDLALRMKDLAAKAVNGSIAVDDLSGATFTVSNLGGLGIETFTPLLNPPQVGILGVGAVQLKPVRRRGVVEFIDSIGLSLTCDHQIIDGAPGARFLQVVRDKIENVEKLCTI